MGKKPMISIKNLSKSYTSNTKAVDNLSLEVEPGEIFALLGPNGAGKSSTIRVLTTLSGFDEGTVSVAGFNVDTHAADVRAAIGYVAQDTGVDFFLSGRENLSLQGHLYKMKKTDIEARIEELSTYFRIDDVLDDLVSSYSGGMRRKLDIATALIHKPKLIFLDEPTLGLDTQSRQDLWQYIRKLNTEMSLTILLTTHYLDEADKLAARVAIMSDGQIKSIGKPETLKDQIQGDVVSLQFDDVPNNEHVAASLMKNAFVKDHKWEQNKLHLYVSNGANCVPQLIEQCNQLDLQVKNVSFARPSLDDVFIKVTGASIESKTDEGEDKWWEKWAGKGGGGAWAKKWQEQNSADVVNASSTTDTINTEENQDWQEESLKWSSEEQEQWWTKQNAESDSAVSDSPGNKPASNTSADASDAKPIEKPATEDDSATHLWQEEGSKWSEAEQKEWWSKQQNSDDNKNKKNRSNPDIS